MDSEKNSDQNESPAVETTTDEERLEKELSEDEVDREASPSENVLEQPAPSLWDEKIELALSLWKAGDNVRLAEVIAELEKAPEDHQAAHATVREMRKRLALDPFAIALWVMTFGLFLLLVYLFVF